MNDYTIWKANFGAIAGAGAAHLNGVNVPEPAAVVSWLTMLAALSACTEARRR
jgi:hypothetical protein